MGYEDQLDRAIEATPDVEATDDRFEIPSPSVRLEGSVTIYENFQETLDRLDRDDHHLLTYLQTDLGTSAGLDERGRARLTGSFKSERLADVLDDYVEQYVRCPECGLPDTRLVSENSATMLKCDACGARSSVAEQ